VASGAGVIDTRAARVQTTDLIETFHYMTDGELKERTRGYPESYTTGAAPGS
jgi:hypothetical protein